MISIEISINNAALDKEKRTSVRIDKLSLAEAMIVRNELETVTKIIEAMIMSLHSKAKEKKTYKARRRKQMHKRTAQEIANFFGVYVAQDESGTWYGYPEKPEIHGDNPFWGNGDSPGLCFESDLVETPEDIDWKDSLCEPESNTTAEAKNLKTEENNKYMQPLERLVDEIRKYYSSVRERYGKANNTEQLLCLKGQVYALEGVLAIIAQLDDSAQEDLVPHQSEVYTNKEYKVVSEQTLGRLEDAVNKMLYKGWLPSGSTIQISSGDFIQTMMRGI